MPAIFFVFYVFLTCSTKQATDTRTWSSGKMSGKRCKWNEVLHANFNVLFCSLGCAFSSPCLPNCARAFSFSVVHLSFQHLTPHSYAMLEDKMVSAYSRSLHLSTVQRRTCSRLAACSGPTCQDLNIGPSRHFITNRSSAPRIATSFSATMGCPSCAGIGDGGREGERERGKEARRQGGKEVRRQGGKEVRR